ncbi:SDR family oxidoreductase [Paracoccus aurantiacus]
MGQFSMKIIPSTGSRLDGNQHLGSFGRIWSAPLGRPGEPNEVAPSMLFLACEDASYMTGQVLHPNGGDLIGG